MAEIRLEATINGRKVARTTKPHRRLLDFLRDDLGLTGGKEGCGAGECGTCSVIVDGVLMKSCLLPVAKAQGSTIETVEALAKTGELSVLQKAFHKAGASQCGYCIPGMLMAATAALRANPFADREEIKVRLGGNICRCTGYQKIFDAVEMARDVQNGRLPASIFDEEEVEQGDFIGKNVRSIDAPGKVTGRLKYAGDMIMPGMLHVQVLRSPHAHARIVSIDTSAAEAMDGVEGVITSADVPGEDGFGVIVNDQPVMAYGKVRYVGEAVAAVAAEDLLIAKRALAAIKVVYEQLPAVFDPDDAMRAGAPVLHDYAPDNMPETGGKHRRERCRAKQPDSGDQDWLAPEAVCQNAAHGRRQQHADGARPEEQPELAWQQMEVWGQSGQRHARGLQIETLQQDHQST